MIRSDIKLNDFCYINPAISLKRGLEFKFIEMQDVIPGNRFVGSSVLKAYKGGSRFKNGDILFARITPCLENGKIAQVDFNSEEVGFGSTEFIVFRAKENVSDPNFLYYLVYSDLVRKPAEKSMVGASGRQRANINFIKDIKLSLPTIKDQEEIGSFFAEYDFLIKNNSKRIFILDEMVQIIFREFFITNKANEWKREKLNKFVDFIRGVEPGSNNYKKQINDGLIPFLRVGDLGLRNSELYIKEELAKGKILKEDDIALSLDGTVGIVKMGMEGCYSTGIRKLERKDDNVSQSFLYCLMKSEDIQKTIKANAKGTTILHAGSAVEKMEFDLPSKEIMESFSEIAEPILSEMLILNKKNKNLISTRDLLLPKLMSSEIEL